MKALSIRQPWAWLILNAGKDIENRDWRTNRSGRILIHVAKGMTRDEYRNGIDTLGKAKAVGRSLGVVLPMPEELERGGGVGGESAQGRAGARGFNIEWARLVEEDGVPF